MEESALPFLAKDYSDVPDMILVILGVWLIMKLILPYVGKKADPNG